MCDTQVAVTDDGVWFAKNSDREPSEAQLVERLPAVSGDTAQELRATYCTIPQVAERRGLILSRPHWLWGAEMGANDAGVVIGNEAVFTRLRTLTPGLLGMDLLRLGLERSTSAAQALSVMTSLLEEHGQGGPAGYRDKQFHYDNSFIIADRREAWVLETAGRVWVARQVRRRAAISNCLTIGTDYDLYSSELEAVARRFGHRRGRVNFAATFDTCLMPFFAGARRRLLSSRQCLAAAEPGLARMIDNLRYHARGNEAPLAGSNRDLCLHAAGPIRRSQTCGSMVSQLSRCGDTHLLTGTSAPCLSLFRPVAFDESVYSVLSSKADMRTSCWWRFEPLHRRALFDRDFRRLLRESRDQAEADMLSILHSDGTEAADERVRAWETTWASLAKAGATQGQVPMSGYWRRLNRLDQLA